MSRRPGVATLVVILEGRTETAGEGKTGGTCLISVGTHTRGPCSASSHACTRFRFRQQRAPCRSATRAHTGFTSPRCLPATDHPFQSLLPTTFVGEGGNDARAHWTRVAAPTPACTAESGPVTSTARTLSLTSPSRSARCCKRRSSGRRATAGGGGRRARRLHSAASTLRRARWTTDTRTMYIPRVESRPRGCHRQWSSGVATPRSYTVVASRRRVCRGRYRGLLTVPLRVMGPRRTPAPPASPAPHV